MRKGTKLPFIYRIVKWTTILVVEGLLIMFLFWIYPQKQEVLGEFKKSLFLLVFLPILLYSVFAVLENEAKKSLTANRNMDLLVRLGNELFYSLKLKQVLRVSLAGVSRLLLIKRGLILLFKDNENLEIAETYHLNPEKAKVIKKNLLKRRNLKEIKKIENWEHLLLIPLIGNEENCLGFILCETDGQKKGLELVESFSRGITSALENSLLHQKVEELSTIDAMTELYNHRYFFERFEEELKRAKRFSLPLSLLISDVDNFKDYVDNNGHQWADFSLKDLGRLVKKSFRAIDIVGRYGGDEFIYFLPSTEVKNVGSVVKRVQEDIKNHTFQGKAPGHLTLSFGAAGFPGDAQTSEELVRKADEALFLAKKTGKNKICIYGK